MERSSQYILLPLLLILLQNSLFFSSANTNINTDLSSLLTLKSHITPNPHNILIKNWTSEASVCSWIGVTCDSRYHRVTQLNISSMGLVGTIPPEIGNLSVLVSLDMSENSFHGPIPPSIFNMSSLEGLNLRNNSFSSSLPFDMCKHNLHRLKRLRISYNELYGEIPSSLDQCSQLEHLSLQSNKFSGHVPVHIGNLTFLQILYLGANNLSGPILSTLVNQSGMVYLGLGLNSFSGEIPPSVCNMRSLQILYISYNYFEGPIPKCMVNFSTSLSILHLNANKLNGLIPSTFPKGCSLQSINVNDNKLEGTLPRTLVNCQGLLGIDIGDNEIQDSFPFWMETLPQLRILVLRSNKFNGTMLVDSNSNIERPFPKLQVMDISQNEFVGPLPVRYIKNFRGMIDANENQIDDGANFFLSFIELKLTLKGLDQLLLRLLDTFTTIDLSSNKFSGSIPPSVGNLNSLIYLNLSHNTIGGHIPSSLEGMSLLESLDLSSNKLDGDIPSGLARLTFLAKLNLSMNNLEGQIPQSTQLPTFGNESYVGNVGLCGFPLTKKCEGSDGKPVFPQDEEDDDEYGFIDGFGWRSVVIGYGCGFVVGIGTGYMIIRSGRPKWLVEFFFGVGYNNSKTKRRNRAKATTRRR